MRSTSCSRPPLAASRPRWGRALCARLGARLSARLAAFFSTPASAPLGASLHRCLNACLVAGALALPGSSALAEPAAAGGLAARAAPKAPAKPARAASMPSSGFELPSSLIAARAQQVFGPLQQDAEGSTLMREARRLRLPGTSRERADLPAGTRLRLSAAHRVRESGRPHDVMLWHGERPEGAEGGGFQDEVAVLAVFRAGEAAPVDVAEVKTDRMTYFAEPAVRPLGAQDELFDLVNHHANAGQPYAEHSLYHLRGGRLRRIVQVDLLGGFGGCAKSFEQTIAWRTEPDAAQPLPRIVAEVSVHHAPRAHTTECRPRPTPRTQLYSGRYRWDAAADRYRAEPGSTLDRLARWNESRR